MNQRSVRWTTLAAALACVVSLATRDAHAQCVVTEVESATGLRIGAVGPLDLDQSMVATFAGRRATVEGVTPLIFRGETNANAVRLYIRHNGVLAGLVGVARGAPVVVERAEGNAVIATLRDDGGLTVRSVRVPCSMLAGTVQNPSQVSAPRPPYAEDRRWQTDATAREEWRCTRSRSGTSACTPVRGRCAAVGDGSVCGYHPRNAQLAVHAQPSAQSASVIIEATGDISFADDSGNRDWLRVYSRGYNGRDTVVVRGWVRRADVRWAQEVPPSASGFSSGCYGRIGGTAALHARVGFVTVAVQTRVFNDAGVEWASTARAVCVRAEQAPNSNVRLELDVSPRHEAVAWVVPTAVRWVERCP